jgi:nucleotide-binding universal stress UspA family protein
MKILLALDGSEFSAETIEAVATRRWPSDTIVRVISVVESALPFSVISIYSRDGPDAGQERATENAKELTTRMADWLRSSGHMAETAVRRGDPHSVILEEAREWGADLIVVGSHGHTGVKETLLGSVAVSVVNHANCSVEVVRRKAETQADFAVLPEDRPRNRENPDPFG